MIIINKLLSEKIISEISGKIRINFRTHNPTHSYEVECSFV